MNTADIKQARFEIRISQSDKEMFERASRIIGHKSMASFVTSIVKKQAMDIIDDYERILATEKDKEIFFDAILSNNEPNEKLKQAANKFANS